MPTRKGGSEMRLSALIGGQWRKQVGVGCITEVSFPMIE